MKMLTTVLAATATAATVAAGGAAFALTGNDQKAPSSPVAADAAAQGAPAGVAPPQAPAPGLPVDPAKCVQLPELPDGHLPEKLTSKVDLTKLKAPELEKLKAELEVEWLKSKLPVDQHAAVPANGAGAVSDHAEAVDPKAVKAAVEKAVARLHAGVPACLPLPAKPGDIKDLPAGVPAALPTDVPRLPEFSCDSVTPVLKVGSTVERSITSQTGLTFVSQKTRTITVKQRKICVTTQRWTGKLGGWMEIERIKGEVNVDQLRHTLRLPKADAVTLGRDVYWRSPLAGVPGTGLMWTAAPGVVDYVSGGLALQPRLAQIAMRLHQVK